MSPELVRRVAFSHDAAPGTVALIYIGGLPLALMLAAIGGIGAWELYRIARAGSVDPIGELGIPIAAALPLVAWARISGWPTPGMDSAAVVVLLVLAAAIWLRGVAGRPLAAVAVTIFGALYTGGMLSFGLSLRYHPYAVGAAAGTALIVLPVALTWASDIGAYFVGRLLGRRKLIPSISPGKTIAGAVGGIVWTVLACWALERWMLRPSAQLALSPASIVLFGLVVSVTAQVGDLAESLLKREGGVKDSSHIIPGHGGILDRLDSLFFVLPVAHLLLGVLLMPAPR